MKNQDELRKQMILLSKQIESCNCPETKTLLHKRARVLLASASQTKINEAKARIDRLNATMPKVYVDNPHALIMIEEKQPGFEKFLPYFSELEKGARMKNQIQAIASQFNIELAIKSTKINKSKSHTRRKKKGEGRLTSHASKKFSSVKFERLNAMNSTIDNKDESMETRSAFNRGKKALVTRETEFNGTRRNDKPTNTRQSWNPESTKVASVKGAR